MTRIRFEDLPSTNTPRNATNLNKLNNVIISSTEPNTGEEVWMKKGKNLLSNNITYGVLIGTDGTSSSNSNWNLYSDYVEIGANKPLTFSATSSTQWRLYEYNSNKQWVQRQEGTGSSYTFTTGSNTKYVRFGIFASATNPMVEQNSSATTYEAYIGKKIYTKNSNNVYEEFYDEKNKEIYSTSEQVIGTWVDGKPLYRKVIGTGALPSSGDKTINHGISNISTITKLSGVVKQSNNTWFLTLPTASVGSNNNTAIQLACTTTYIYIAVGSDRSGWSGYVVIEYTKTTD